MRLVSWNRLKENMVVGKTIFKSDGTVVINKGISLKKSYIEKLKNLGIDEIYIEDGSIDDENTLELIQDETRKEAIKLIHDLFDQDIVKDQGVKEEILNIVEDIIEALFKKDQLIVELIDIKSIDGYTFNHSLNVCILSLITGISMGYNKEDLLTLGIGAMLHDIGKTKITPSILNKTQSLTQMEFDAVKKHTLYGYKILKYGLNFDEAVSRIALCHHERYDGQGYTLGLRGEGIDDFSKIVAVADVYDALTSNRVYKEKIEPQYAVEYLMAMQGRQFDPEITNKFLDSISLFSIGRGVVLNTGEEGYVVKVRKAFPTRPVLKIVHRKKHIKVARPYELDLLEHQDKVIMGLVGI